MHVLVSEYCCAAGPGAAQSDALLGEGRAMLAALSSDLIETPGVDVAVLWHDQLGPFPDPRAQVHLVRDSHEELETLARLAPRVDATIAIAPETAGLLAERAHQVRASGGHWLGAAPDCVLLCTDKLQTEQRLRAAGVATTSSCLASAGPRPNWDYPLVIKPRDGAGAEATHRIDNPRALQTVLGALPDDADRYVLQPLIEGCSRSIAAIVGGANRESPLVLPPVEQLIEHDGEIAYTGGRLRPRPVSSQLERLVTQTLAAVEADRGWFGIDFVETPAHEPVVVDVNPRLTTSYVLYRTAVGSGLAACMLGRPADRLEWPDAVISCDKRGGVRKQACAGPLR